MAQAVDITSAASTEALARVAADSIGGADILVNNAAIYAGLERTGFEDISETEWDRVISVNVQGTWMTTRAVTRALGDDRITVNAIAPGFALTQASLGLVENAAEYGVTRGALKRAAVGGDIVGAALFLAYPQASFITGQTLIIDGGRQFL